MKHMSKKSKTWAEIITVFGSRCTDMHNTHKNKIIIKKNPSFCTVILVPSLVSMKGSFLSWHFWTESLWSAQCQQSGHATFLPGSLCDMWKSQAAAWCTQWDNAGTATLDDIYLEVSAAFGDGESARICSQIQTAEPMGMSYFTFFPQVQSTIFSVARSI